MWKNTISFNVHIYLLFLLYSLLYLQKLTIELANVQVRVRRQSKQHIRIIIWFLLFLAQSFKKQVYVNENLVS